MTSISKGAARRLANAARVLSEDDPAIFVVAVGSYVGLPITEEKLQSLSVEDINRVLSGDDGELPENYSKDNVKQALRHLWGEQDTLQPLPSIQAVPAGMNPDAALQVAVASNNGEQLDGHFGSCLRFLIYKVSKEGIYLADVRDAAATSEAPDRNEARAALLQGCQLLYVQSIGGPAAAKVVKTGVHPVKFPKAEPARIALEKLQQSLDAPPPWLARVLGTESSVSKRFSGEEVE